MIEIISVKQICNLGRVPVSILHNPLYNACTQIVDDPKISVEKTELYNHYKAYNPKTLYDIYGVCDKLKEYSYCCIFLPWAHYCPVSEFRDHAFINRAKNFTKNEIKKIKLLISSIQESGYKPEKFLDRKGGHITGYFLKEGTNKKFYIVSGNHRASVLSALFPDKPIPVNIEKKEFMKKRDKVNRDKKYFKETYDVGQAEDWPSVVSGFLKKEEAIQIARKYLDQ